MQKQSTAPVCQRQAEIILWPNLCYEFLLWLICQRETQPLGFWGWHFPFAPPRLLPPSWWTLHKQWALYYLIKLQLIIHKKSFGPNANSMHFACVQTSPIDYWQMRSSLTLFFWMQHWIWLCAEFAVKLGHSVFCLFVCLVVFKREDKWEITKIQWMRLKSVCFIWVTG